jgi:hypothetical protein
VGEVYPTVRGKYTVVGIFYQFLRDFEGKVGKYVILWGDHLWGRPAIFRHRTEKYLKNNLYVIVRKRFIRKIFHTYNPNTDQ